MSFDQSGLVFDIRRYAVHDGPGIRTTVFFKGCPLRCRWCHNPESQEFVPELLERTIRLSDREWRETETCGRRMTVREVLSEVEKDRIYYDQSGGGVTFSGGEPLAQPAFLTGLLAACREREIHTCLDTSGFADPELLVGVSPLIDLFYYDLKLLDDTSHRCHTGVPGGIILENLKILDGLKKRIVVRFPFIPGITATAENMLAIAAFMSSSQGLREIHILPYHRIAIEKYKSFGKENPLADLAEPPAGDVSRAWDFFESFGFIVKTGG
jgi:pyruvate formate lyase activating enzyme